MCLALLCLRGQWPTCAAQLPASTHPVKEVSQLSSNHLSSLVGLRICIQTRRFLQSHPCRSHASRAGRLLQPSSQDGGKAAKSGVLLLLFT